MARLRVISLAIACGTLAAVAVAMVVNLWSETTEPISMATPSNETAALAKKVKHHASVRRFTSSLDAGAIAPGRSNSDGESATIDDIPDVKKVDDLHPGFAKAYQDGRDQADADFLARERRRCSLSLPKGTAIEWQTIETYQPDGSGDAVLREIELFPVLGETVTLDEPKVRFLDCLASAMLDKVRIRAPESMSQLVRLRNGGSLILAPEMTNEEVAREVTALRERASDESLSAAARARILEHLRLYECYAERGVAGRRECLEESLR